MKQKNFIVLIWPLLGSSSLHFFCSNRLSAYFSGGKDVLYEFLKSQNFNWRGLRLEVAHQLIRQHNLQNEKTRALVVDDTIKHRRGRKVAATSSHFDHTLGKKAMGQQVLEAGLATQKGYAPLDSQIYVSKKKVLDAKVSFKDKLSAVARDYEVAKKDNKKINGLSFSRQGTRANATIFFCPIR